MIVTQIQNEIIVEDVQAVLEAYPLLGHDGFTRCRELDTHDVMHADILAYELPLSVAILRTVPRTKTKQVTTYNIKHRLEPLVGYMTNGECTVACLLAGFEIERIPGSPNVLVGVHRSWIRHQYARDNGKVPFKFEPRATTWGTQRHMLAARLR